MTHPLRCLPSLLLVAAPLAIAPAADAPRLAVEPGLVLRKQFTTLLDLDLDELTMTFDGQEISAGDELSIEQVERTHVEFVDTYRAFEDGRVTELVRAFETLESESRSSTSSPEEDTDDEQSKTSALEGLAVVFRWDADDEEYAAEFDGDGGDDALLEDLEQDVDLAGFLPDGDVEVDATWTVGTGPVGKLLSPGGDLSFVDEDGEDETDDELGQQFEDNLTGELTATFRGKREEDGVEVLVIELEGELETEAELEQEGATGSAEMTITLAGELWWNAAGGHFHSIRLTGPCEITFASQMGDGAHDMEQTLRFSGTFEIEGTAERE